MLPVVKFEYKFCSHPHFFCAKSGASNFAPVKKTTVKYQSKITSSLSISNNESRVPSADHVAASLFCGPRLLLARPGHSRACPRAAEARSLAAGQRPVDDRRGQTPPRRDGGLLRPHVLGGALEAHPRSVRQAVPRAVAVPTSPRREQGSLRAVGGRADRRRAQGRRKPLGPDRGKTARAHELLSQKPLVHRPQKPPRRKGSAQDEDVRAAVVPVLPRDGRAQRQEGALGEEKVDCKCVVLFTM